MALKPGNPGGLLPAGRAPVPAQRLGSLADVARGAAPARPRCAPWAMRGRCPSTRPWSRTCCTTSGGGAAGALRRRRCRARVARGRDRPPLSRARDLRGGGPRGAGLRQLQQRRPGQLARRGPAAVRRRGDPGGRGGRHLLDQPAAPRPVPARPAEGISLEPGLPEQCRWNACARDFAAGIRGQPHEPCPTFLDGLEVPGGDRVHPPGFRLDRAARLGTRPRLQFTPSCPVALDGLFGVAAGVRQAPPKVRTPSLPLVEVERAYGPFGRDAWSRRPH